MEKYIIMGYEFDDKASADAAKNELEMISKIKSQGNMNNHKIALSVYNKLLEDNLFKTPIGLEYMRSLQKELLTVKTIDKSEIKAISKRNMLFICLSGLTTGLSWLCYYKALQDGQASVVVPIDKLSILVTIAFSYFVLKEKLTKKSMIGLVLITAGTLLLVK